MHYGMHEQLRKIMKIRELLAKAGGIQYDEDGDELTPILVGTDLAKFAELIVRECAEVADGNWADPGHQIKLHFEISDPVIQIGSRVRVLSGFGVKANGTVNYIEPSGKLWVRHDGATSDVFYRLNEVKVLET